MAARTDHDRRDAQQAARSTVAIYISRYVRRVTEEAYAHIEEVNANHDGEARDWSAVGVDAAHRALSSHGIDNPGLTRVLGSIESAEATPEIEA